MQKILTLIVKIIFFNKLFIQEFFFLNNFNATPFHWSAAYGHLDILKFYLDKFGNQIDINVQNLSGVTPLHLASYSGHLYIVKFLVEQPNIDIFKKDDNGTLPLEYGANNPQIVGFLKNIKNIDINHQNFQGNSFLHFASRRGNTEAVKILLNFENININLKNEILFLFLLIEVFFYFILFLKLLSKLL